MPLPRNQAPAREQAIKGLLNVFAPSKPIGEGIKALAAATGISSHTWTAIKYKQSPLTLENAGKVAGAMEKLLARSGNDKVLLSSIRKIRFPDLMSPRDRDRWLAEHPEDRHEITPEPEMTAEAAPQGERVVPLDNGVRIVIPFGTTVEMTVLPDGRVSVTVP